MAQVMAGVLALRHYRGPHQPAGARTALRHAVRPARQDGPGPGGPGPQGPPGTRPRTGPHSHQNMATEPPKGGQWVTPSVSALRPIHLDPAAPVVSAMTRRVAYRAAPPQPYSAETADPAV